MQSLWLPRLTACIPSQGWTANEVTFQAAKHAVRNLISFSSTFAYNFLLLELTIFAQKPYSTESQLCLACQWGGFCYNVRLALRSNYRDFQAEFCIECAGFQKFQHDLNLKQRLCVGVLPFFRVLARTEKRVASSSGFVVCLSAVAAQGEAFSGSKGGPRGRTNGTKHIRPCTTESTKLHEIYDKPWRSCWTQRGNRLLGNHWRLCTRCDSVHLYTSWWQTSNSQSCRWRCYWNFWFGTSAGCHQEVWPARTNNHPDGYAPPITGQALC